MVTCAHGAHEHTPHALSPRIPKYAAENTQHDPSQCCSSVRQCRNHTSQVGNFEKSRLGSE